MKKQMALLFAVLLLCSVLASCYWPTYHTRDIREYGNYEGHIEHESSGLFTFRTRLAIFPKEIEDSYTVHDFFYSCSILSLDNMYQIVLDYSLPQTEFEQEVARIAGLGTTTEFDRVTKTPLYDDAIFPYPAYITLWWGAAEQYEYALIDEENCRIICVFSMYNTNKMPLSENLRPSPKAITECYDSGFSIYSLPE